MGNCSFCQRITTNKNLLWHDGKVAIILDIDPISRGHALIVPIQNYHDADDMPADLLSHIMLVAQRYIAILKDKYKPSGYSIMQNGGTFNELQHYHLHVFQRNDPKEFNWTYSETRKEDMAFSDIKNELSHYFE